MPPLCFHGEGRRQAQDVFVQPQQQPTLGFGAGVERADVIFQRGCCTPACFTFWVNKVWRSVEGLSATRWNVAHGGRAEVERSSRRWMHACKIWELHVKMDSVCVWTKSNEKKSKLCFWAQLKEGQHHIYRISYLLMAFNSRLKSFHTEII